jgi:hypothetical protein
VINALPGLVIRVDNRTVSGLINAALLGKLLGYAEKISDQLTIGGLNIIEGCNVLLGNDENMRRSLRVDIFEGNGALVLIYYFSRTLALYDFTKDTRHMPLT